MYQFKKSITQKKKVNAFAKPTKEKHETKTKNQSSVAILEECIPHEEGEIEEWKKKKMK